MNTRRHELGAGGGRSSAIHGSLPNWCYSFGEVKFGLPFLLLLSMMRQVRLGFTAIVVMLLDHPLGRHASECHP